MPDEPEIVQLEAVVNVGAMAASLEIKIRVYLSVAHLVGASYSALRAKALEDANDTNASVEHSGNVSCCIIGCAAFLEASINEFYCGCADAPDDLKPLGAEAIRWMGKFWELGFPRTAAIKITDKYELALKILGRGNLDSGKAPAQNVKALINLRNALTHYEPEWISTQDKAHKLEKQLKGQFAINPLTGSGNPFWPSKCLGYGCCKWAVENAVEFHRSFWIKLGIPGRHQHVYNELPKLP